MMGINTKPPEPTYDPKCEELARAFLEGDEECIAISSERYIKELAAEIQGAIENYIQRARDDYEPPDPPGFEAGFAENH